MAKDRPEYAAPVAPATISESAFHRILALRKIEVAVAERLRTADDYPDFFVEGSGPPWHERWPEVIRGKTAVSEERMLFVDALKQDDYPDFFVEGSGPPWHERWPEVVRGESFDPANVQHRIRAIRGLNVMQAFLTLQQRRG